MKEIPLLDGQKLVIYAPWEAKTLHKLKFNSHHINVVANAWSTKCKLIACMSAQIRSNLRDESIKPN
jgi:hypothetical protein